LARIRVSEHVVLLHPGKPASGQGRDIPPYQRLQSDVAGFGQQHRTQADQETALGEAEFLYSLNRLNVSVTRAKSKCAGVG
jgi:hypothetical protein